MERSEHGSRWRGRERGRTLTRAQRSEGCAAGDCVEAGNGAPCDSPKDGAQPRSGAPRPPGLSKGHISVPVKEPKGTLTAYPGASRLRVTLDAVPARHSGGKRGTVQGFSRAARRRLLDLLATLQRNCVPAFVTLTFPDEFPVYREDYKNFLDLFGQRLLRRWPTASIIWKLEFIERKSGRNKGKLAPHYHLFLFGVPGKFSFREERGVHYRLEKQEVRDLKSYRWLEWIEVSGVETIERTTLEPWSGGEGPPLPDEPETADTLRHWISRVWFDVVGSDDARHYRAGTRVEQLRTIQGAFRYAAKSYLGKAVDAASLPAQPGRFWGVIGRRNLPRAAREGWRLSLRQTFQLLRIIRRYRRAQASNKRLLRQGDTTGAKVYCCVDAMLPQLERVLGPFESKLMATA
jgi:hypothetical protein